MHHPRNTIRIRNAVIEQIHTGIPASSRAVNSHGCTPTHRPAPCRNGCAALATRHHLRSRSRRRVSQHHRCICSSAAPHPAPPAAPAAALGVPPPLPAELSSSLFASLTKPHLVARIPDGATPDEAILARIPGGATSCCPWHRSSCPCMPFHALLVACLSPYPGGKCK